MLHLGEVVVADTLLTVPGPAPDEEGRMAAPLTLERGSSEQADYYKGWDIEVVTGRSWLTQTQTGTVNSYDPSSRRISVSWHSSRDVATAGPTEYADGTRSEGTTYTLSRRRRVVRKLKEATTELSELRRSLPALTASRDVPMEVLKDVQKAIQEVRAEAKVWRSRLGGQFIRFARPGSRLGGWISAVDQSFGHATLCPLEGGQMPQPQPGTNCRCVAARQPLRKDAALSSEVAGWLQQHEDVQVLETRVNPQDHNHVIVLVASVEGGRPLGWVSAREPLTNYPVLQPHDEIVGGAVRSLGWVPQPMPGVAPDPATQVLHAHVTPGAVWTDARSAIPLASPSAVGAAAYARGSGTLALDMNGRARGAAGGAAAARGTGASQLHLIC